MVAQGVKQITLDGDEVPDGIIPLVEDGGKHEVQVKMGK